LETPALSWFCSRRPPQEGAVLLCGAEWVSRVLLAQEIQKNPEGGVSYGEMAPVARPLVFVRKSTPGGPFLAAPSAVCFAYLATFCTVIGDTPNCLAITRMPGLPDTAMA
jgi:hypothetical protein